MTPIRPPYNTAAPAEWEPVSPPPYDFLGVTMRVFPLQADLRRLEEFCDSYLNLMPPEIACFRPSAPIVLLVLVDYGKMVSEVREIGWVSQRETGFIVPVTWMREMDGEEVFVDWASVAPYIFVDQPMSVTTGREIYGWPKEMGWFEPGVDTWTDVRNVESFRFRLSTKVHPHLPPVPGQGIRTLFTIRQGPLPRLFTWPPSAESALNPLRTVSNLLGSSERLMTYAASLMSSALRSGPGSWGATARAALEMTGAVWPLAGTTDLPRPMANTINLKQFRDALDPRALSYQALTSSRMTGLRYGTSSLMGMPAVLAGDPTGGYEIKIHSYPCYPIAEHLGLLGTATSTHVQSVRPLFPFQIEMDLRYEQGEVLCWRSRHYDWCSTSEPGPEVSSPAPYNTTLGKHEAPLPGSFRFPSVTWRLLALKADPQRLQKLTDDLINSAYEQTGGDRPFRATLPWVLFGAINFCSRPDRGQVNCWRDRELAFYVPVERTGDDGKPELWFLAPVVFSNDEVAVITLREVLGLPASQGAITSPPVEWMASDPMRPQSLVRVHTEVVTDADANTPQSEHVVISVVRDEALDRTGTKLSAEDQRSYERIVEQIRDTGLLHMVTLKQFRDVHDPSRACYQSIAEEDILLQIREHGELEGPLAVRIRSYPSQPIVEILGLEVARTEPGSKEGGLPAVDILSPERGIWLQGAMDHKVKVCRDVWPPPPPGRTSVP